VKDKPKLATMADVAKLAGVSSMTVSRALKPETSVSKATRDKIQKAADDLGYVLDTRSSEFSSGRSGFVAVTIPSINNGNFADTVKALSDVLAKNDLQVLLGYSNYHVDREEQLITQLLKKRPVAIIVTGGVHTDRCRNLLENSGIPVVETWDIPENPVDQVVGFSNAYAAELMIEHFIKQGHTKIGFIGGDNSRDSRGRDRYEGFCKTLEKHGLDASRISFQEQSPFSMEPGVNGLKHILKEWPDTQAIMCVSDPVAFGAVTECKRLDLSVPDTIAIGGFGAYELGLFSNPSITTIDVGAALIGQLAAEKIVDLLSDSRRESNKVVQTKPRLIKRQSA
jgi:LacI family gluconate utilization system Gnt-I transcriptional repressor